MCQYAVFFPKHPRSSSLSARVGGHLRPLSRSSLGNLPASCVFFSFAGFFHGEPPRARDAPQHIRSRVSRVFTTAWSLGNVLRKPKKVVERSRLRPPLRRRERVLTMRSIHLLDTQVNTLIDRAQDSRSSTRRTIRDTRSANLAHGGVQSRHPPR